VVNVAGDEFPARVADYDGYVITGSKYSVNDDKPWIHRLFAFIREMHAAEVRVVGCCFGAQAVAVALGGEVRPNPLGWDLGLREVAPSPAGRAVPALAGAPWPLRILESHRDIVTRLPAQAVHLGASARTPHELFAVGENMLCLQGHPEFDGAVIEEVIELMQDDLTPEELRLARDAMGQAPHRDFLREHLLGFLMRRLHVAPPAASAARQS
jgi:GMP synthase (glutamine-hydrolysing)